MNIYNYSRGSEWRKWDLHVHTPISYENHFSGWDTYIKKLKEKAIEHGVEVVGINDYFSVDGYEKLLDECEEETKNTNPCIKLDNGKMLYLFPVVELRLENFTSDNESVNIHVVFSPDLLPSTIRSSFLEKLRIKYQSRILDCKEDDLIKIGNAEENNGRFDVNMDLASIPNSGKKHLIHKALKIISFSRSIFEDGIDRFQKILKESGIEDDKYLIIIANKGRGGLDAFHWHDKHRDLSRAGNIRQNLLNLSDVCFSNDESDIQFLLGQKKDTPKDEILNRFRSYKPCIWGSDAHTEENLFHPSNGNTTDYTWIKADPTFEGLKQIIYEPEERVKIQKENPNFEFDKPYFERISIKNDVNLFEDEKVAFSKKEIPLNKNLVTIIGGRGTGKSLLVNYLAYTFNKNDKEFKDNKEFEVDYAKNNVKNVDIATFNAKDKSHINYIFIEQSKLKTLTGKKAVGEEFKKLLQLEDLQFDESLNKEIINLIEEIEELKKWFNYETENNERINDKDFNEKKRGNAEQLLKTITTKENAAKLLKYTDNVSDTKNYENILLELNKLKEKFEDYSKELNVEISILNDKLDDDFKIEGIIFNKQLQSVEKAKNHFEKLKVKKESENIKIKKQFESEGYKGDLIELLKNAERYQRDISGANKQLVLIGKKEIKLKGKIELRNKLGKKLKQEHGRQAKIIEDSWINILDNIGNENQKQIMKKILADRGIQIKGKVTFDLIKFNEKLENYLDKRVYKNLGKDPGILNLDSYYEFMNKKIGDFIEGNKKDSTKKNLGELFFDLNKRKEYLYTIVEPRYNKKTLEKLSAGQKGTLYLLLQLATKAFSTPLIFDQPEDDLDNEFIIEELVDLFKELKKYRQIIIVTHNANLVVTADAEQVIVANNNDENITYFFGSLDNHTIIENVCKILEGGKNAFEKRKRRYNSIASKEK
jgi:ABC-type phosphate transport system ATPase subunit